jgi:hypothetical protein
VDHFFGRGESDTKRWRMRTSFATTISSTHSYHCSQLGHHCQKKEYKELTYHLNETLASLFHRSRPMFARSIHPVGMAVLGIVIWAISLKAGQADEMGQAPQARKEQIPTLPAKILKEKIPTLPAKILKESIPTPPARIWRQAIPSLPAKNLELETRWSPALTRPVPAKAGPPTPATKP